jgi:hypothetical protein
MRARSRMAALALVAGTSIAMGRAVSGLVPSPTQEQSQSQDTKESGQRPRESQPKPTAERIPSVRLNIVIAGLSGAGCDVEVKPGNGSCAFRVLNDQGKESRQHVTSDGRARVELRDVELRGADRTVTVAITVNEQGQASRTVYRGFRLPSARSGASARPSASAKGAPAFTCYLSAPSRIARVEESRSRK